MLQDTYMQRALQLAMLGNGNTAPNPMVGAVLVYNNRIIGEGWHKEYGQPHAEVNCLNSVTPENRALIPQSTMYVSLEPCAHFGKTPPCAHLLIRERVKKVIICNKDPFEMVNGGGIQLLREAGIEVECGLLEQDGEWLNRRFFHFHRSKRPYIILKWAQSSEGKMSAPNGERKQISNTHTSQLVHKWRTEEAAIMIGTNTALNDNPELTARLWEGNNPLRIVLDKTLRLPGKLKIFDHSTLTWIINETKNEVLENLKYIQLPFNNLLPGLVEKMYNRNLLSLFVEGGPTLLQSFINAGLWDEARIFTAPITIPGGGNAPSLKNALIKEQYLIGDNTLQIFTQNTAQATENE